MPHVEGTPRKANAACDVTLTPSSWQLVNGVSKSQSPTLQVSQSYSLPAKTQPHNKLYDSLRGRSCSSIVKTLLLAVLKCEI
jgi:hypothetical protein